MEGKFSTYQKLVLRSICKKKQEITIIGVNSIGLRFLTTGRIAVDTSDKICVDDDSVFVEFGNEKPSEESKITKWSAQFNLEMPHIKNGVCFAIEAIYNAKGKCIYNNKNFDDIKHLAKYNNEFFRHSNKYDNVDYNEPWVFELRKYIAQPVTIKTENMEFNGLIENIKGTDKKGNLVIELTNGCFNEEIIIEKGTEIYSIEQNNDKNLIYKSKNESSKETKDKKENLL